MKMIFVCKATCDTETPGTGTTNNHWDVASQCP
jgi:hypothetical protein